jgi:Cu/Ag efflux protein CusF
MRKIFVPAAAAAVVLAGAFSAFAAGTMTTGVVKAVDVKAGSLTLADGTTYMFPKNFINPGLKAGEKVKISWQLANNTHQADKIVMAE